jgi:hypothetical protein
MRGRGGAANHPAKITRIRCKELRLSVCLGCINDHYNYPHTKNIPQTTHAGEDFDVVQKIIHIKNYFTYCPHMPKVDGRRNVPCSHYRGQHSYLRGANWYRLRRLMEEDVQCFQHYKHLIAVDVTHQEFKEAPIRY